jgi:DNA invertase Pin-like site-specific DNA recombinase
MTHYIAYLRVSMKKQELSGLSLEWQESAVKKYIEQTGGVLQSQYQETETGTRKRKRIEIYKALSECERTGATLIVAKLDRLSRDVQFIASLLNSKVKFICLDIPEANETTIYIMSAIAQQEAKRIRERIVNALSAKRNRGETLGNLANFKGKERVGIDNSVVIRMELAKVRNEKAVELIRDFRNDAGYTFDRIADKLNKQELKTQRGNPFTPKMVELLYKRYCIAS